MLNVWYAQCMTINNYDDDETDENPLYAHLFL